MVKKPLIALGILVIILTVGIGSLFAAEEVPKTLISFAETVLADFGKDPGIIQEVLIQNNRNLPLGTIKQLDDAWKANKSLDRFMWEKLSNTCAFYLVRFQIENPFIVEIFVMDNQGANVGQTNKTSDYWQGDEAKFIDSYKNGAGAVQFGDAEYDASVDEIIVQVSVPVMAGPQAIGAITFGVSLDRWEKR